LFAFRVGACPVAMLARGFLAAPIAGHLSDKMGRRQVIVSSFAMTAVVLLFMALAGRSVAFVFFVAILGFFLFAIRAVLQAWLLDATPRALAGTSIGFMFGMQAIGAAIGPILAGMIADRYGLSATFYFLAVTIVIANVFMMFTPAPEPREDAAAAKPAAT
jgi:MFS family permease